jgi:hypothetical protein
MLIYVHSQVLTPGNQIILRAYHDSIRIESDSLVNAWSELDKSAASMKLIRYFSKVLRVPGAYQYAFDSLSSIAILEPEDKLFRIFTWQLAYDNGTHRYFGVIQTNAAQPALYPLVDYSTLYQHPDSIIVDHDRWIGALYYKIIPVKSGKTTYYTLFGWNAGNVLSNKKIIDVLWWDDQGKPRFGYPLFDMLKGKSPSRITLEYKKDASLSLTYIPEEQSIYYDHLVPLSGKQGDFKFDYVPDGTLEGFVWKKGKWKQVEIIDYEKRQDGQAPNVIKEPSQPLYQPLPPR